MCGYMACIRTPVRYPYVPQSTTGLCRFVIIAKPIFDMFPSWLELLLLPTFPEAAYLRQESGSTWIPVLLP